MIDEHALTNMLLSCPTRERATQMSTRYLSQHGWFMVENDDFDVFAVHSSGIRLFIKFWITPSKKPVPKFYIKKFDKAVQKYIYENDLIGEVEVLFISNSPLDNDAYAYYQGVARFTMKLGFAATDIKAQIVAMQEEEKDEKDVIQKELLQYASAAKSNA